MKNASLETKPCRLGWRGVEPTPLPYVAGMTSGELFLFGVVHQIVLCREDVFSKTPNLQRWYKRIESLPKTQEVGGPRECFPAFVPYTA